MYQLYIKYILLICISIIMLTACSELQTENKTKDPTKTVIHNTTKSSTENTSQTQNTKTFQENKGKTFIATIIKVIDGDTVKIELPNGNEETVRLLLIDTPETVHPTKAVQPFGPEASQFSKKLMPANSKIEVELGINERDKYGRLLAYLYVDDKMVNKLLLEKGLARVAYIYVPNTKYLDEFEIIQKKAQKKAIGIWSLENYVTSRGFNDSTSEKVEQKTTVTERNDCSKPTIKGNINSKGQKIYHIPLGQYYEITKAEEMFCTEKEAQAAGFRKSER